ILYRGPEMCSPGFIVCHSYGLEFLTLRRLERAIARKLASIGHPVLAFHGRGYGDSTGSLQDATLESHVDDIVAAAEVLGAETVVGGLGLIGARFGGLVAGLAARRAGAERLILVSPAVAGGSYFRSMIRQFTVVRLASADNSGPGSLDQQLAALRRDGVIDVLGHALYRPMFEAASAVDLAADMSGFSGDALIVQVSKLGRIGREIEGLRGAVERAGGRARVDHVLEPPGASFGGPAFVSVDGSTRRVDVQWPIVAGVLTLVEEWMNREEGG
ncbi:MAG: serine aminopeptidase domain-containing protein, partial [Actinomycetota bacterium]